MNIMKLLYPPKNRCILCGVKTPKALCNICSASIEFIHERKCLKCGKGLADNYSKNICPDCMERSYSFHSAYSCFYYRGTGRELIHAFKYEGRLDIAKILARYMVDVIYAESLDADMIVPVPIFQAKLHKRGFNQAAVIGEHLSKLLGIPMGDCLIRNRETKEQYGLDKLERRLNVNDAFSLNMLYNVKNMKILLIDDIYTTGSTVHECSKILLSSGAKQIYVLTAAAGTNT
ncbi:MAG TPA: ComF family protein [Clostridiaceae bacterium]|nr:ComF family protein [Clostridiaceae bacterium]